MKTKFILIIGLSVVFVVAVLIRFDLNFGKNKNPIDSITEAKQITNATKNYIYEHSDTTRKHLPNSEWLMHGDSLNDNMIMINSEGFIIKDSEWIFFRVKNVYVGINTIANNDFTAIVKLQKIGKKWVVYNYFLSIKSNAREKYAVLYSKLEEQNRILAVPVP